MHDNWKAPKIRPNINGGRGVGGGGRYSHSRHHITWSQVPPEVIGQFVQEMCGEEFSITLSQTKDGGALSVTLLMGDNKLSDWPHSLEDLFALIGWCHTNLVSE